MNTFSSNVCSITFFISNVSISLSFQGNTISKVSSSQCFTSNCYYNLFSVFSKSSSNCDIFYFFTFDVKIEVSLVISTNCYNFTESQGYNSFCINCWSTCIFICRNSLSDFSYRYIRNSWTHIFVHILFSSECFHSYAVFALNTRDSYRTQAGVSSSILSQSQLNNVVCQQCCTCNSCTRYCVICFVCSCSAINCFVKFHFKRVVVNYKDSILSNKWSFLICIKITYDGRFCGIRICTTSECKCGSFCSIFIFSSVLYKIFYQINCIGSALSQCCTAIFNVAKFDRQLVRRTCYWCQISCIKGQCCIRSYIVAYFFSSKRNGASSYLCNIFAKCQGQYFMTILIFAYGSRRKGWFYSVSSKVNDFAESCICLTRKVCKFAFFNRDCYKTTLCASQFNNIFGLVSLILSQSCRCRKSDIIYFNITNFQTFYLFTQFQFKFLSIYRSNCSNCRCYSIFSAFLNSCCNWIWRNQVTTKVSRTNESYCDSFTSWDSSIFQVQYNSITINVWENFRGQICSISQLSSNGTDIVNWFREVNFYCSSIYCLNANQCWSHSIFIRDLLIISSNEFASCRFNFIFCYAEQVNTLSCCI